MSTNDTAEAPLNSSEPYYRWQIYEGKLMIMSECCADTFSEDQEAALLKVLIERRDNGTHAE